MPDVQAHVWLGATRAGGGDDVGAWDPFLDGFRITERFGGRFKDGWPGEALFVDDGPEAFAPASDVFEDREAWRIEVELPGVSARDLFVTIDADVVRVEAERTFSHANGRKVHALEGRYGRMARQFTLPPNTDVAHAVAELHQGVLRISVPRRHGSSVTRSLDPGEEDATSVPLV